MTQERRRYVQGLAGQVHLREQGAGTPLLLVHQSPWSSLQYHAVAPRLAAQGFHTIAPDSPAHGLSDPLTPSIAAYADNLARVLDALSLPRVAIAGHHTGAMVALCFAARHPDRTLALVTDNAPLYTPEERAERRARPSQHLAIKPDGSHFTDRWAFMRRLADPEMTDASVHLAVLTFFNNALVADDPGHTAAFTHDLAADVPNVRCPTLIIASRTDPLHPHAARLRALRPDFHTAEFPGGTATVLDSPDLWAETVGSFLKTHI